MYLSKLTMDPHHPSVRQSLRDRQDMHRNLAQAFGVKFLYRVIETKNVSSLLVLSRQMPDQKQLESRGYHLIDSQDFSGLPALYKENSVLRFNILAVPSKKVNEKRTGNSRRMFLSDPAQRILWLKRQGEKYGFDILNVCEPSAETIFTVGRKTGTFQISAVEFSGAFRIKDASLFWQSWENGIGPEKAYGAGLMLLSK